MQWSYQILYGKTNVQALKLILCGCQNKKKSIGVDDRTRRNCSGNIINDITYRKRLREYKTYLIKSGVLKTYIENIKNISKAFCKRATTRN